MCNCKSVNFSHSYSENKRWTFLGTQCIYDDELGYWAATKLHTTQAPYYYDDSRREFGISPGQFVLNFCSTATRLRCRRRKSRRYAALPFLVRYTNRPRVHQRRYTKRTSCRVSLCRGVGGRVGVHTGHHLDGALLRHLPAADVAALADPPARLPHHRRRVARRPGRHDADRRLPAPAAHAHRRPQVRRDLGRPLPRKGSRCLPVCSPNDPTACVLRAAVTCGLVV